MTQAATNPFPNDADRHALWEMLIRRDTEAFLAQDWEAVQGDFIAEGFFGIDGRTLANIDSWRMTFPTLDSYRATWVAQAADFAQRSFRGGARQPLYDACTLRDIEITGDVALAHKKFDGWLEETHGNRMHLLWQTLYVCRKVGAQWKIASFVGYLPFGPVIGGDVPGVVLPTSARAAATGPYSPVLEVNSGKLVVISGQAAVGEGGAVVGDTIEEQTHCTISNCLTQLKLAGCTLRDVFKANIYMTDLNEWERMNTVYSQIMPEPRPARTTVGVKLLRSFKIEIDMWAAKPN